MDRNMETIVCPNCGITIDVESILLQTAEAKIKSEYTEKFMKLNTEFLKNKELLRKEKEEFEEKKQKENELFFQRLNKEKQKIALETEQKIKEQHLFEMKTMQEEIEKKRKENLELRQKEIEILRKEQDLKEKQDLLQIEHDKQLIEAKKQIEKEIAEKEQQKNELFKQQIEIQYQEQKKLLEEQLALLKKAREEESEKHEMEKKQIQMQMEQVLKQSEEMRKKVEQGSMQLQGEVQEVALEEKLKTLYLYDEILEVPKGFKGADVIQVVYDNNRNECGKIIYESKRTKNFSEDWIQKLKQDQLEAQAQIAVIVTEVMPKDMPKFGEKDSVWICTFNDLPQVSFVLREMMIREFLARKTQENKGDKMVMLYNYLTSIDFKQRLENIFDAFTSMKSELEKEKRAYQRIWKEREVQIERVFTNSIDMYSTFKGIAGKSILQIDNLQLPEDNKLDW
jgi:hypothetical protein